MSRFDYVKYDQTATLKQGMFKEMFQTVDETIEKELKNSRAKALVLTKLEEAYMWIGKAIRDEQIELRKAELQEERSNE